MYNHMSSPFSTFADPELAALEEKLALRRQQFAAHCLREKPTALIEGLPVCLTQAILRSISADESSFWLATDESQTLLPVWNNGPDAERFVGSFRLPSTHGITGFVFTSGMAACESEVCFNQLQNRELDHTLGVLTWAMIAVPLTFAGATRGVITAVRLIRLSELPELARVPMSRDDFPAAYVLPPAFSLQDLNSLEAAASAVGRIIEHRLTSWVLGTEE